MNNKGFISIAWMTLFYYLIITCLVALFVGIMVKTMIVHEIDVQETHAQLFIEEVLQSRSGVSYVDSLGRVHPGIISLGEFTNTPFMEQRLIRGFAYGEKPTLAAEMMLFTADGTVIGTLYYDKEWYDRWSVLSQTLLPGKGSATAFAVNKTVLLFHNDGRKDPGVMQFTVVMPNS